MGCGDNLIRVWQTDAVSYDVKAFWKGVQGRVHRVCWHPSKEGVLAFGLEVRCCDRVAVLRVAMVREIAVLPSHVPHRTDVIKPRRYPSLPCRRCRTGWLGWGV